MDKKLTIQEQKELLKVFDQVEIDPCEVKALLDVGFDPNTILLIEK